LSGGPGRPHRLILAAHRCFRSCCAKKKTTIRRIFDELEELDRLIVWSHVVDGESVQAIARRLGIGWHRVNATIQRVLVELRQVLLD
jgi:DNA-directed RNA polymerase specialized sigma24 family protein